MNGLPMTRSSIRGALTVGFAATGILMTGCSSHLRAADQVLELPRMSGLVQSFPMSAADMAATLPVAATRAGWSVVKDGGPSEPWILELPWGFNEAGIWARVVMDQDGGRCVIRVTAITKNDIDRAEDPEGHTRLLIGWIVVTAQARLEGGEK